MAEHLTEEELAALALSAEDTPRLPAVQHLEECAECNARVVGVQRTMRAAQAFTELPASTEDFSAMRARLEAQLGLTGQVAAQRARAEARTPLAAATRVVDWVRLFVPVAASVLLAFVLGKGGAHPPALGLECAAIELGAGALFAAGGYLLLRERLRAQGDADGLRARAPLLLASVAGTGALLAQVWLHEHCPAEPASTHAFVSHTGAVILVLVLGLLMGPKARRAV
jgi:hypothetical protein